MYKESKVRREASVTYIKVRHKYKIYNYNL